MGDWETKEFDVVCRYPESFSKKLGNQWDVAKKLSVNRKFSLLAASYIVEEFDGVGMTAISCVDAVPSLGIAGLVWKKILKEKVSVTVNVKDEESVKTMMKISLENKIKDITFVCQDANSLLHSEKKFNLVYLEAYGTTVRYLEAACRATCHRGLICVVSTDMSTLYNKCPPRVQRLYYGQAMKHEYYNEFAVRLIVANIIRAASRWDKGVDVLLTHVDGNSITVIVRVMKGAVHADRCLSTIQKVAHCRICNYRQLIAEKLYYNPKARTLKCLCDEDENNGVDAPIALLGPVGTGKIFNAEFLFKMLKKLSHFNSTDKTNLLLKDMIVESMCFDSDKDEDDFIKRMNDILKSVNSNQNGNEPPSKKVRSEDNTDIFVTYPPSPAPVFYYVAQVHTKKGFNPPRIQALVKQLRASGFKAAKTLFDPRGIRTSANSEQFNLVIDKICKETL